VHAEDLPVKRPRPLFTLAAAALCGGCFLLPFDGEIELQGSIVSAGGQPVEGCTLTLDHVREQGRRRRQEVSSSFDIGLTISPSKEEYVVTVSCPGHAEPYKSKVFTHSGKASEPAVDLGVIVIK
jgi:hypothetical protein